MHLSQPSSSLFTGERGPPRVRAAAAGGRVRVEAAERGEGGRGGVGGREVGGGRGGEGADGGGEGEGAQGAGGEAREEEQAGMTSPRWV